MGNETSTSGNKAGNGSDADKSTCTEIVEIDQSKSSGTSPYKMRKQMIKEIQQNLTNNELDIALAYLVKLRRTLGLDRTNSNSLGCPDMNFILDEFGIQHVLTLTRLLRTQPTAWETDAELLCHRLLSHFGPPSSMGPQELPKQGTQGLLDLNLMGIDLGKKNRLDMVKKIITGNRELRSVELAFSRLDDDGLLSLLPALSSLESLSSLGLRGNKLHFKTVEHFTKMLEDESVFPSLMWIDLKNNGDIYTLPNPLLSQLQARWPDMGYHPSLRQLADGSTLMNNDVMDICV